MKKNVNFILDNILVFTLDRFCEIRRCEFSSNKAEI